MSLATKAIGTVVRLKDAEALQNELKNDYIIAKELSALSGGLALKFSCLLIVANAFLITAKHVDLSAEDSRDSDNAKQSAVNDE